MKINSFIFAMLLLATAACTKDELADGDRLPEGQYPLEIARITLGVEGSQAQLCGAPQTRVSEIADGTGSMFDAGDKFSVQIDGEEEDGTYAVQDNNTVKAETTLYWSDRNNHTVNAWYPATGGTLDLSNQTNGLAYVLQGTGTGNYQTPVTLNFTHALAKVRITPSDDALGDVTSLQLYTYTQCAYEKGNAGQGSQEGWIEMKPCEYTENGATITCWEANVVPGYAISKLRANGNEERDLSAAITPEAGKFYDITLDKDKGYTVSEDGNTYEVYNADGLKAWAEAAKSNLSLNCTLTADIILPEVTAVDPSNWTPIGNYENKYTGTFDGGGHTITGLTVTTSDYYAGLFGYIGEGGKVQNLTLENVNLNGTDYVGGVVGYNYYGTVTACTASGIASGTSNVGGVVGYNYYGTVTACNVSGSVSGSSFIGGVVGTTNNGAVTACSHVSGSVSGFSYIGGVVGHNVGTVTACHASGDVIGTSSNVGGVVGFNNGTLTACYHASGNVSGTSNVGGVVGYYKSGTLTACYWSDYDGNGIGKDNASIGTPIKVDGTTVTWQNAVDAMNAALQSAGSEWRYELIGALPTLKKQ